MTDRDWTSMSEENFELLLNRSFDFPPPDDIITTVNPWRKAMNRALWGLALTTVTLNVGLLNYILPTIGVILALLGFRTLRRDSGWFRACYVLTILQAAIRFPCLILNATIYQKQAYATPVFDVLTVINISATFVLLFCLWQGFKAVQRKAGVTERAAGAAVLMVWYAIVLLLGLIQYSGLILFLAVITAYIFILRTLFKLSKELDEAGYAIQAAPVRVPDWLLGGAITAVLVIGIACGYLFANSYSMEWTEADPAAHSEVQEVKDDLMELGFPEDVLNDLTAGDILACEGAVEVVVDTDNFPRGYTEASDTLRITNMAVKLPGEQEQWKLFHHFRWLENPGFYGTEVLRLLPAHHLDGWTAASEVSGRVLCTENGQALAAPYYSLVNETYTTNTLFWGQTTSTEVFAEFSLPRGGEDCRGYLTYSIRAAQPGWLVDSWIYYEHQASWAQYPVLTAKEHQMETTWSNSGAFFTIRDALQFVPPEGSEPEPPA